MVLSGVFQPAGFAAWLSVMFVVVASIEGQRSASVLVAVGHPAKQAAAARSGPWLRIASISPPWNVRTPFSASAAVGVGHPVEPVADMRSTDARRRERDRPDPVIQAFQVILYKVDPRICVTACNLLSKDDCRAALLDEPVEMRPKVPLVIKPSSRACRGERLARAGTSPNRSVIGPAGAAQGQAPDPDSGEKMALLESAQVGGVNIFNAPFVHHTRRDVPGVNEVAQPLGRIRIDLVVVNGHG
jgi:hypothetical protein